MTRRTTALIFGVLIVVAVAGVFFAIRARPKAVIAEAANPSSVGAVDSDKDNGKPKYTVMTPEIVRTTRTVDWVVGGALARKRNAKIDAQEADWGSSQFLPASSSASTLAAAWRSSVRDNDGVLTPDQLDSLLTKLAEYVHVRAQKTPDAYFALAAREPNLVWKKPEALYNPLSRNNKESVRHHFRRVYEYFGGGVSMDPHADTPKLLRDLWRPMMDTYGQRIAQAGVGERGAAIIIMRSRLPERTTNGGFAEPYASQHGLKLSRWIGYGTYWAQRLRTPVRTSDDVLNENNVVLLAACHIITRIALNDYIFKWGVYLFYDPQTGKWEAETMDVSGSRRWEIMF